MFNRLIVTTDKSLIAAVQMIPASARPIMEFATLIGQPVVVGVLVAGVGLASFPTESRRPITWAAVAAIAGILFTNILKLAFRRTRPDTYIPFAFHSYSFPSGHAAGTMIGFGLLAWLAAKHLPSPWGGVVMAFLIALILLVGISRIFLGAHFPTDVLGGWMIGGAILAVIIVVFKP